MRHLHTSGTQTTIRLGLNRLNCLWLDFYRIVIQYITPPRNKLAASRPFRALSNCLFGMAAYGRTIVCLIAGQYVQACTTKYIFKIGKNRFDRITAILVSAGRGGWQPFRGQGTANKNQSEVQDYTYILKLKK
jgi:hypothetical protein